MPTINYCDYTNGNDSTGDGSAGNPYKTIDKASTGLTGGDEVRCAKSAAPSALNGTLAWVDGSASITTSADLTAVLATKDFVGKDTAGETWWEISSLTSTIITLAVIYRGTTATMASKKLGITDTGTAPSSSAYIQQVLASGASIASRLKTSGGWDLGTEIQDGETWFLQSGTLRYGYGLLLNSRSYIEISALGFLRYRYGAAYVGSVGSLATNLTCNGCGWDGIYGLGAIKLSITNCNCHANGDEGLWLEKCLFIEADSLKCYSNSYGVYLMLSHNLTFRDLTINGGYGIYIDTRLSCLINLISPVFKNLSTGILARGTSQYIVVNYLGTNVATDVLVYPNDTFSEEPVCQCQHFNIEGDNRCYYEHGMTYRDVVEARSGACLKFDPSDASYYIMQKFYCKAEDATARTIKIYMKDDADFNGDVQAALYFLGKKITGWTEWTMTTSYVEQSIIAAAEDVTEDGILELRIKVRGTTGNVYADDFSYS